MAELKNVNKFDNEIVKLIELTGMGDMMLQMLEMGLGAAVAQLEAEEPDFPSEKFVKSIQQRVDINTLLYQLIPIYSRHYTQEEITALITFYETPLGRKLTKETPQVLQKMIAANQAWCECLAEEMGKDLDSIS